MPIIRRGFFDSDELEEMNVGKNLIEDTCKKCGLYKGCLSPKMPVSGEGKKKIYVLCEAPGETEDRQNTQLIGEAGSLLRNRLRERGINLDQDCWKDNSVRCRPLENRTPTKQEIKFCKDNIDKDIKEKKPDFIWLFGKSAIESFYIGRFSDTELKSWRGLCIPDKPTGAYVIPMYHPSYVLRNETDPVVNGSFDRDLDFAVNCLKQKPYQHKNPFDFVFPLKSYNDIIDILTIIAEEKPEWFFFDYETTGLKPYNKGHKIACISGCDTEDYAFSFLYDHTKHPWNEKQFKTITDLWKKILLDPEIKKASHNQKFEDVWSRVILKVPKVASFAHCSMNAAHIIASQRHTNLKWQTYANFGIDDYSKNIKRFLESTDEKGFNKVMDAPVDELLLYSALDSLFTNWLTKKQQEFFAKHLRQEKARLFFQEGLNLFADMQMTGFNTDPKYYAKTFLELTDQLKEKDKQLKAFKEVDKFKSLYHKEIDFESATDLRKLFFDMMKLKSVKTTDTGLESTDKSVVAEIDHPIAKNILEKRKLKKMRDYVGLFYKEINDDGRIRPFYNLHIPVSFRSSSSEPNWQNIPVRDEEAKRITRLGIMPSKGNITVDFDFRAIEVRSAAMYTKDPVLIAYIKDPKTDMHQDQGAELFLLDTDNVSKEIRFYAKNGFVFPEFYGSYYVSTAKTLWAEVPKLKTKEGRPLLDHLKDQKITTHKAFEEHVKQVEKEYWKKFKVFKQWQESAFKQFADTGFIDTFFGFRMGGYLGRNEIINYRFQATAFHCLLWSIIEIDKEFQKKKMGTKIVGQVHDCGIMDTVPEEKDEVIRICQEISTQRLRKEFSWINVPLEIEIEATEVNQSWYYKKEVKFQ